MSHLGVSVGQFVREMGQMGHRKGVFHTVPFGTVRCPTLPAKSLLNYMPLSPFPRAKQSLYHTCLDETFDV